MSRSLFTMDFKKRIRAVLLSGCLVVLLCHAAFAQDSDARRHLNISLDNTNAVISVPDSIHAVICTPFNLVVRGTFTDARNFDLHFYFPASEFTLLSVTAGSDPNLHILPYQITGDSLYVDGFWHPNFTGTDTLFTLHIYPAITLSDSIAYIRSFHATRRSQPASSGRKALQFVRPSGSAVNSFRAPHP